MESSQVKIVFDELGRTRIYRGKIIKNDDHFLVIDDIMIGLITLNKKHIIKIEGNENVVTPGDNQ